MMPEWFTLWDLFLTVFVALAVGWMLGMMMGKRLL